MTGEINHPLAGNLARPVYPSPIYDRLRLEAVTAKEAAYHGDVGGVDRPLPEVPLGWGEDLVEGTILAEQRT